MLFVICRIKSKTKTRGIPTPGRGGRSMQDFPLFCFDRRRVIKEGREGIVFLLFSQVSHLANSPYCMIEYVYKFAGGADFRNRVDLPLTMYR